MGLSVQCHVELCVCVHTRVSVCSHALDPVQESWVRIKHGSLCLH